MTAATLTRLPLSAGGVAAGSVLRGGVWTLARVIDGGFWAAAQFMRAPVAISCVIGIVGFSLLAGANALYFQTGRHPAPFFFAPPKLTTPPVVRPVVPAPRPRLQPTAIDAQTTGSVAGEAAPIGNADVLALQKKLVALGLLNGTPDGLFGRRTAVAIRAFETKVGLQPHGRLTREVLAAITAYPLPLGGTSAAPVQPLPTPVPLVATAAPKPAVTAPALAPAPTTVASAPPPSAPAAKPASPSGLTAISVKTVPVYAQANPVPLAPLEPAEQLQPMADDVQMQATAMANAAPAVAPAAQPQPVAPVANAPAVAVATIAPATAAPSSDSVVAMNSLPPAQVSAPAQPVDTTASPAATVASVSPAAPASIQPAPADTANLSPAQRLAQQMGTLPPEVTPGAAVPPASTPAAADNTPSTDPVLVGKIQRALASLGFLGQRIDGVAGEATAKAIRNFEEFYNYKETGQATSQLLQLLLQKGATI